MLYASVPADVQHCEFDGGEASGPLISRRLQLATHKRLVWLKNASQIGGHWLPTSKRSKRRVMQVGREGSVNDDFIWFLPIVMDKGYCKPRLLWISDICVQALLTVPNPWGHHFGRRRWHNIPGLGGPQRRSDRDKAALNVDSSSLLQKTHGSWDTRPLKYKTNACRMRFLTFSKDRSLMHGRHFLSKTCVTTGELVAWHRRRLELCDSSKTTQKPECEHKGMFQRYVGHIASKFIDQILRLAMPSALTPRNVGSMSFERYSGIPDWYSLGMRSHLAVPCTIMHGGTGDREARCICRSQSMLSDTVENTD